MEKNRLKKASGKRLVGAKSSEIMDQLAEENEKQKAKKRRGGQRVGAGRKPERVPVAKKTNDLDVCPALSIVFPLGAGKAERVRVAGRGSAPPPYSRPLWQGFLGSLLGKQKRECWGANWPVGRFQDFFIFCSG